MNKKTERNIIWTLAFVLIFVSLVGCVATPTANLTPKKPTLIDSVIIMKDLGTVLGCMFGANDPACQRESLDPDL